MTERERRARFEAEALAWSPAEFDEVMAVLPAESEAFEERAAMREFDGGYTRAEAERLAVADWHLEELAQRVRLSDDGADSR